MSFMTWYFMACGTIPDHRIMQARLGGGVSAEELEL